MYRIGLSQNEISEEVLQRSQFKWEKVHPREKIVSLAEEFIGVPYVFGSSVLHDSPRSFDCSSFTSYLYVRAGFSIPRICDDQYHFGKKISETEAKPGDLVFFQGNRSDISKDKIGHGGVYIGNGEMIQAGGISIGYGKVVKEKITESKYYQTGFMGYRRLITDDSLRYVIEIPEDRPDLRIKENLLNEVGK